MKSTLHHGGSEVRMRGGTHKCELVLGSSMLRRDMYRRA